MELTAVQAVLPQLCEVPFKWTTAPGTPQAAEAQESCSRCLQVILERLHYSRF